jgi:hypothetical protein
MESRDRIGVVDDDIKRLLGPELSEEKRVQGASTKYSDNHTEGRTRFYRRESRIEIRLLATSSGLPRLRMHKGKIKTNGGFSNRSWSTLNLSLRPLRTGATSRAQPYRPSIPAA